VVNPPCLFPLITLSANFRFRFVICTFMSNSVPCKILLSEMCSVVGAKLPEKHAVTRLFPEDGGSKFL